MRWQLRPPGTLEISLNEGPPPTREEVDGLLDQVKPVVTEVSPRVLVVDGAHLRRRRGLTFPEVEGQILYEAARWRTSRAPQEGPWGRAVHE